MKTRVLIWLAPAGAMLMFGVLTGGQWVMGECADLMDAPIGTAITLTRLPGMWWGGVMGALLFSVGMWCAGRRPIHASRFHAYSILGLFLGFGLLGFAGTQAVSAMSGIASAALVDGEMVRVVIAWGDKQALIGHGLVVGSAACCAWLAWDSPPPSDSTESPNGSNWLRICEHVMLLGSGLLLCLGAAYTAWGGSFYDSTLRQLQQEQQSASVELVASGAGPASLGMCVSAVAGFGFGIARVFTALSAQEPTGPSDTTKRHGQDVVS